VSWSLCNKLWIPISIPLFRIQCNYGTRRPILSELDFWFCDSKMDHKVTNHQWTPLRKSKSNRVTGMDEKTKGSNKQIVPHKCPCMRNERKKTQTQHKILLSARKSSCKHRKDSWSTASSDVVPRWGRFRDDFLLLRCYCLSSVVEGSKYSANERLLESSEYLTS
jgi:hypothetical protein